MSRCDICDQPMDVHVSDVIAGMVAEEFAECENCGYSYQYLYGVTRETILGIRVQSHYESGMIIVQEDWALPLRWRDRLAWVSRKVVRLRDRYRSIKRWCLPAGTSRRAEHPNPEGTA